MTMGLTGLARTIMPSTMTSLPMCSEPNVRSWVVWGRPRKRTATDLISWAYSGSSIWSCAYAARLACWMYSSGLSTRVSANSVSAVNRSSKSTVMLAEPSTAIWLRRLRYLSDFKKSWKRDCGSMLVTVSSVKVEGFSFLCKKS